MNEDTISIKDFFKNKPLIGLILVLLIALFYVMLLIPGSKNSPLYENVSAVAKQGVTTSTMIPMPGNVPENPYMQEPNTTTTSIVKYSKTAATQPVQFSRRTTQYCLSLRGIDAYSCLFAQAIDSKNATLCRLIPDKQAMSACINKINASNNTT